MKTRLITKSQRLELFGLQALARRHNRALRDIEEAACEITGEEVNVGSHTGDFVYDENLGDVDALLKRLKIEVSVFGKARGSK